MAWQPDGEQVRQLASYLRDSLDGSNKNAQKYAELMLRKAMASPDYANYLTYILACQKPADLALDAAQADVARAAAAISLKNIARAQFKTLPAPSQSYIQSTAIETLQDPNTLVRSYTGNVIAAIVLQVGIFSWPEIVPQLLALAANERGDTAPQASEAAMSALLKVCEDNQRHLNTPYQGQRALNYVFPKLISLTNSPNATIRSLTLQTINIFVPAKPKALVDNIDSLMTQIFKLALDQNENVRRFVCRALVQMLEVEPDKLLPHLKDLVTYMIEQQKSDDPEVALEAAEFWMAFGEQDLLVGHLQPYLGEVIPLLLNSMVYSDEDQARHEQERDDAEEDDKVEDIKPVFAKGKGTRGATEDSKKDANGATANGADNGSRENLSEGEIEDDGDEDGVIDPEDEWNLRKCSAAALDVLATKFHQPVFEICLPYLRENLTNSAWPKREAAVLAIGAVAEGCMQAVTPHLPELVPFLIGTLADSEPVVRKITCWTLGRYSKWAAFLPPDQKQLYYEPMMDGMLKRMLDSNKAVQEAAASAFSSLEESSGKQLLPYCKVIIEQFVKCFAVYKHRNMFILYDCVQTLAENLGEDLAQEEFISILMPALNDRYAKVPDEGQEIFPLLECLSYVAPALANAFAPYAPPVFQRCVKILHTSLQQEFAVHDRGWEQPDKDFRITSLDLLSSIIQALSPERSIHLVTNSQPALIPLLEWALQDHENDVKQSAFALLGDCAKYVFPCLQPQLPRIMPILISQLDVDSLPDEIADDAFSVVNNACWSCGEIALMEKEGMSVHMPQLYERFSALIANLGITDSIQENACIAMGRLGMYNASFLAPKLGEFGLRFVTVMKPVEFMEEKTQAFIGLNRIIVANPQAMEEGLVEYFSATAKFCAHAFFQDNEVKESFDRVINCYKQIIPDFAGFLSSRLTPKDQALLKTTWGL